MKVDPLEIGPTDIANREGWQAERLVERLLAFTDPRHVHLVPLPDGRAMAVQCKPWRQSVRSRPPLRLWAERIAQAFGGHVESLEPLVRIRIRRAVDPHVIRLAEAIGRRLARQAFAKRYGGEP